jgi:protein-tyrosine phosphatase
MIRVLFVCLGNICRSPLGEGIFRHLVTRAGLDAEFEIDSAGTGSWHVGAPPHHGSQRVARDRGVDLTGQRARQVQAVDLQRFDYILAMDSENFADLNSLARNSKTTAQIHRMLDFAPRLGMRDVPDPYLGGPEGFDQVFDLVEEACQGLLAAIAQERGLKGLPTG